MGAHNNNPHRINKMRVRMHMATYEMQGDGDEWRVNAYGVEEEGPREDWAMKWMKWTMIYEMR